MVTVTGQLVMRRKYHPRSPIQHCRKHISSALSIMLAAGMAAVATLMEYPLAPEKGTAAHSASTAAHDRTGLAAAQMKKTPRFAPAPSHLHRLLKTIGFSDLLFGRNRSPAASSWDCREGCLGSHLTLQVQIRQKHFRLS
jgi:hypothetical protein